MDFSLRRINGENIHYYESDTESDIQLIFLPGGFNPQIWKHQLRYFSKKYTTISFRPTESFRDFKGEKANLDAILDKEHIDNAVLISNFAGNAVSQSIRERENVKATVMSGVGGTRSINCYVYRGFRFAGKRKPKLLRKSLFSNQTKYGVLKDFVDDVEVPEYENLRSFLGKDLRENKGLSLVIHAEDDRFSDLETVRELGSRISVIQRAGTFSFYEKPQDYNKALNDFLDTVEEKVREDKIKMSAEENRSLIEFDQSGKEDETQVEEKDVNRVKARR